MTGAAVAALIYQITLERSEEIRDEYAIANARVVSGAQRAAAVLALAYIAAYMAPVRSPDLDRALAGRLITPENPKALAGLLTLWGLLDKGADEQAARAEAGRFVSELAAVDTQGAARAGLDEGADATGRKPKWRLELYPGACAWCEFIAWTGERYLRADSVPMPHSPNNPKHPGGVCNCGPAPEFEELKTPVQLTAERIEGLPARARRYVPVPEED